MLTSDGSNLTEANVDGTNLSAASLADILDENDMSGWHQQHDEGRICLNNLG